MVRSKRNNPIKQEEPEEYEVESIVNHKIDNKTKDEPILRYNIKWKNYSSKDNTWESESAVENAKNLVKEYWAKHGGMKELEKIHKKLNEEKASPKAGRKAPAKSTSKATKSASLRSSQRKTSQESTGKKRKLSTAEDTSSKKRASTRGGVKEDVYISESEEEYDVNDEVIEKENFRSNASWEDVSSVQYVKRKEDNGELYAIIRWNDGKLAKYKTSVVAKKAPLKLIDFYENRLSFEEEEK